MIAFKCDNCGKYFEKKSDKESRTKITTKDDKTKFVKFSVFNSDSSYDTSDLCDVCFDHVLDLSVSLFTKKEA